MKLDSTNKIEKRDRERKTPGMYVKDEKKNTRSLTVKALGPGTPSVSEPPSY